MLAIIANEVAQSESVVRGYEIEARTRATAIMSIKIAAAGQPRGKLTHRSTVAFPKVPDAVAIFAIPFRPKHREVTHLITFRSDIPRLSDKLQFRKNWVLLNDIEE